MLRRSIAVAVLFCACGQGTTEGAGGGSGGSGGGSHGTGGGSTGGGGDDAGMGVATPDGGCQDLFGEVCGQRLGLDPTLLYNCASNTPTLLQTCVGNCSPNDAGSDVCTCPNGNGTYCG